MDSFSQRAIPIVDFFVLLALTAIAIAQPFYDTMASGSAFFVAHNVGPLELSGLLLAVSVLPAAALILLEIAANWISTRLRLGLHLLVIWMLAVVFVIVTLNEFAELSTVATLLTAAAVGAAIAALVVSFAPVRNIVSFASIGVLYFPALFVLLSPVSTILFGASQQPVAKLEGNPTTPVVILIFDEMNPLGLLDADGRIDDVRFPNIASFAKGATWFPNASSVHPESVKAVPAILTGKKPPKADTLASLAGYPDNLFALLGGHYDLNVAETFTALCPVTYCPSTESDDDKQFNIAAFTSDVRVILGHIFLPKQYVAESLPPLDEGWKNFGNPGREMVEGAGLANLANEVEARAAALAAERRQSFKNDRLGPFNTFLARIKPGERTLDVAHIVFPHTPYEYLPDMVRYNAESDGGSKWGDDQNAADEAYRAYLLQLGSVDTLVGRLVHRLKDVGKFDDAMIILVADHGRIFRKGSAKRALTPNTPDVLHMPLIIKFPQQAEGQIRKDFVLTTDVVPTVADVLGFVLPWKSDGVSVLRSDRPERQSVRVSFRDVDYEVDLERVVDPNGVPDRIAKFGSRTPLEGITVKNQYADLLRKRTEDLPACASAATPRLVGDLSRFRKIDLTSGYLPLNVKGRIVDSDAAAGGVAVAVNEMVSIVTSAESRNGALAFSALLPRASLRDGANDVSIYLILSGPDGGRCALLVQSGTETVNYELSRAEDGTEFVTAGGRRYPLSKERFQGVAGEFSITGDLATISGWSADVKTGRIPLRIIAFADGRFVGTALVDVPRGGVAKRFANPNLLRSGYELQLPRSILRKDAKGLRLLGLTTDGVLIRIPTNQALVDKINESLGGFASRS